MLWSWGKVKGQERKNLKERDEDTGLQHPELATPRRARNG
jgi:hypothetical protein